jgi:hypothetical protein
MSTTPEHSLTTHPMRAMMSADEFRELARKVQFCEVSWPIGLHVLKGIDDAHEAEVHEPPLQQARETDSQGR